MKQSSTIFTALLAAMTAASVSAGAAGASSEAEASGSSLSSKASGWETTKHVAEAGWKELTGQQGYTSSFRGAGEAASSQLTPDAVAGAITGAQANPAGAAAGAAAVGSAASPIWETIRTDAANGWPVGRTLETYLGLGIGSVVALAAAAGLIHANEQGIIELPDIPGVEWPRLPRQ